MDTFRLVLASALILMTASSCQDLRLSCVEEVIDDNPEVVLKLDLSCESLETDGDDTRSLHDDSALRKITNANYYLFHDGVMAGQGYFEDASDFAVSLPSYIDEYSLFVLANVGEMRLSDGMREDQMAEAVHVDYLTRENYFGTVESYGFPMSLTVRGFSSLWKGGLQLRRLVHALYVTADDGPLASTAMKFTGLSIRNAARDVYPFAERSRARHVIDGDAANLDSDDMEILNGGGRVVLYLLENMRGDLFPGNKDWKHKVPSEMAAGMDDKDKCSYLELTASAQTATAFYGHNIYRAYIGESAADCNVRRNSCSIINNRFTNDMIVDEEWRIDSDEPVVTGTLAFVGTLGSVDHIDESSLFPGFKRDFYIYRSNSDIRYVLSCPDVSEPPYISCSVVEVNDLYARVTVETEAEWGMSEAADAVFEIKSEDGLIHDRLDCSVCVEPPEIRFSYGPYSDAVGFNPADKPKLMMNVSDALGLGFDVKVEGTCGAYIFYHPNGTWGRKEEEEFERRFETGTRKRIYPESGRDTPIDEYLESTVYNGISNSGLYELFAYDIWYFTRKDSYNMIGHANEYYKHFQPSFLSMEISLEFGGSEDGTLYPSDTSTVLPAMILNDSTSKFIEEDKIQAYTSGTDFGIYWNQIDDLNNQTIRRIEYTEPLTQSKSIGSIGVAVNGSADWSGLIYIHQ